MIDVALMVGTDFNEGIHGIGAKTGLKLIRNNTLEDVLVQKGITDVPYEPDELRNIFLKHEINPDYDIKFKKVDIEKICDKMKKLNSTQKSLDSWF